MATATALGVVLIAPGHDAVLYESEDGMATLRSEAHEMLQRWTNRTTGIRHMGFVATYRTDDDASLTNKWGKTIDELREIAASRYASAQRVMIMGLAEHEGQPVMRLEAWQKSTGESVALIQRFRRGLFNNYPRPTGAPLEDAAPPPPRRSTPTPRLP